MQDDLLERSFEAATAKYRRMHGLDQQPVEASSQVVDMADSSKQAQSANSADLTLQLPAAASEQQPAPRIRYTKAELTDIAELCTAAPVNTDILPNLQALHLDTSPPTMHKTPSHPHIGGQNSLGVPYAATYNQPQGSASQQQSINLESQTESVANGANEQMQQAQLQDENQQYSEADWAAYWQYYGHTVLPPAPPPPPQLCPRHMQLLEQLCAHQGTTEPQSQPAPPTPVQPAVSTTPDDTRGTLQARAQQVQGGNLTSLLMAWFEAGYQTGRHEALSQKQ